MTQVSPRAFHSGLFRFLALVMLLWCTSFRFSFSPSGNVSVVYCFVFRLSCLSNVSVVYCFVFRLSCLSNVSVVYGFVFRFRLLVMFLWCTVLCFVFVS